MSKLRQYTRWTDESCSDINIICNKFDTIADDDKNDKDKTRYINWKTEKIFTQNQKTTIDGKEIEYNVYQFEYLKIPIGIDADDFDVANNELIVIIYKISDKIKYIINRSSQASTILRRMLSYTQNCCIKNSNLQFNENFFMWLINKFYTGNSAIETNDGLEEIKIEAIKGFKGDTNDSLTTITATGTTVMNILSTLSFLVESQNLKQITIVISDDIYGDMEIRLYDNNSVTFKGSENIGTRVDASENGHIVKSVLNVYMRVLPNIILNYKNDIESDVWDENNPVNFLQTVANDLSEQVKTRIAELEKKSLEPKIKQMKIEVINKV